METIALEDRPQRTDKRELIDRHGRRIDHLRLSVTAACDLRCLYCRPPGNPDAGPCGAALTDAQRVELVRFLVERYGLRQVRITGGEPLVYPRVVSLVESLREAVPDISLAMTTNGRLLSDNCRELRRAGLDRLNVSLDSLDPERYRHLTGGRVEDVMRGLDAAVQAAFPPPKINTVVLRDVNDREVIHLARWAIARGSEIRFLEAMPIGPARAFNERVFVSAAEIRRTLTGAFDLMPRQPAPGETARCFTATSGGLSGIIGTIAPVTEPFCGSCRRIRVTVDGRLFACLLDDAFIDLKPAWPAGRFDPAQAMTLLQSAAAAKPPRGREQSAAMVRLGG